MADPVKKSGSKSTAKKAEAVVEKPDSGAAKKRATTSKAAKPPAEPGKVKTEPQVAPVPAAEAPKPAKAAKTVTARATNAKEETSPLIHKSDAQTTPADGPKAAPAHPEHNRPRVTAQERYDLIAMTAYFLYTQRGGQHGKDIDDWVTAEAQVAARLS